MDIKKNKDYIICIDSDGCAINSMTVKHEKCFGPQIIRIWKLHSIEDTALKIWNQINLYSINRGINRFKGLVLFFERLQCDPSINNIVEPNLQSMKEWVMNESVLSNDTLERKCQQTSNPFMKQALDWSCSVNECIKNLETISYEFQHVKESLSKISRDADIVVVSSANKEALKAEWETHGYDDYIQAYASQEDGTKTECIKRIVALGYDKDKALMIGDSLGDYEAAKNNGILFYPIIPNKENESWKLLYKEGLDRFIGGTYQTTLQAKVMNEFEVVLN